MNSDFADLRVSYERDRLADPSRPLDPFDLFEEWLHAALAEKEIVEPYAVTVATVDAAARPSSRIVLLRGFDRSGFTFYTNYESRKGAELAANPAAAMLFWWGLLQRQIRIEGNIVPVPAAESDAYFVRRPRGHRLSAWASHQSTVVPDRAALERDMEAADARFPDEVPRPPYWGGYRLEPRYFEFWQGRRSRVHDRLAFERSANDWQSVRLAP